MGPVSPKPANTARIENSPSHRFLTIKRSSHLRIIRTWINRINFWINGKTATEGGRLNKRDDAISMLFFRYNIPCNIENVDVTSRTTTPINVEENMKCPQQNEAPQESNEQQPQTNN